jgi:TrmH family RNA methyltransferase
MAKKTEDFEKVKSFLENVEKSTEAAAENAVYLEKIESLLNTKEENNTCYICTIHTVSGVLVTDGSECLIAANSERALRELIRCVPNHKEMHFYFDCIYNSVMKEYITGPDEEEPCHIKGQRKANPARDFSIDFRKGERIIANKKDDIVAEFKKYIALKARIETGHVVMEGMLMVKRSLKDNLPVEKVVYTDGIDAKDREEIAELCENNGIAYYRVSSGIMSSMTTTNPVPEILCITRIKNLEQNELIISRKKNFFLILDGIANPDNLGMVLRTADASGVDAVILLSPSTHHFNKNAIRGGRGAVGRLPIYFCSDDFELMDLLREHGFKIWGTSARFESENFYDMDFSSDNLAVVVGNESNGVRKEILDKCTDYVKIPMVEGQSSLNIAVAAALVLYEYDRTFYTSL